MEAACGDLRAGGRPPASRRRARGSAQPGHRGRLSVDRSGPEGAWGFAFCFCISFLLVLGARIRLPALFPFSAAPFAIRLATGKSSKALRCS